MTSALRVARTTATVLVLAAGGGEGAAQASAGSTAEVRVQLAADPEQRGPAALTWLRARILPALPTWATGRDPFGELALRLSPSGLQLDTETRAELGDSYLRATIQIAGVGTLRVRGGFDGLEVWQGDGLRPPHGRLSDLLELLGLERHSGPVLLDVSALVGGWLPGLEHTDPLSVLLGVGPAECGELTLLIDRQDRALTAVGRSQGGVLLPAILWILADLRARPADAAGLRPITAADPWILLARSARDAEREEATRQLVLCDGSIAQDTLERLLLADDFTRVVAMDALVRRRSLDSLERVVDAATPSIGGTEELAEVALLSMLPLAANARRQRILGSLPDHPSPLLRSFGARWREPGDSAIPADRWLLLFGLLVSTLGLVALLGVRAVRRRVSF